MARRYWLVKSDPDTFSWDDLEKSPGKKTCWDGVRSYQARNTLRDEMKAGDGVLFYHSQIDRAVVGLARIVQGAHPDPTQFDPKHAGFDPAATREAPRWFAVDLQADRRLPRPVGLDAMRRAKGLEDMVLLRKGSRLSVQPVTAFEWKTVLEMGGV
jgi:predicted RNA-binding protein with PUA-like domain